MNNGKKSILKLYLSSALVSMIIGFLSLTFTSCEKAEDVDMDGTGMLSVTIRTWNTINTKSPGSNFNASYNLNVIDMRSHKYEMKFTTEEIKNGLSESKIKWVTAYTSNEFKLDSERDFEFELPAGKYKGFAISMGNELFWVISDGNKTVELPDTNGGEPGSRTYNVFGSDGLYEIDSKGLLERTHPGEKIGTNFTIYPGKNYSLTMRVNFDKMEWHDNDNNGVWSNGDTYEWPTFHSGTDTMWDFIFKEVK